MQKNFVPVVEEHLCNLVFDAASQRKNLSIVGTKNKEVDLVAAATIRAQCHYVNRKWLSVMLMN